MRKAGRRVHPSAALPYISRRAKRRLEVPCVEHGRVNIGGAKLRLRQNCAIENIVIRLFVERALRPGAIIVRKPPCMEGGNDVTTRVP